MGALPILLTVFAFSLDAWGIDLSPPEPGRAGRDNTLVVTGAIPGEGVWLTVGQQQGTTPLPGCDGVFVQIDQPLVRGPVIPNGQGVASFTAHVSPGLEGKTTFVQAVQRSVCALSPRIQKTWPFGAEVSLATADAAISGTTSQSNLGHSVAIVGDVNRDGFDDILTGAPGTNERALLFYGPVAGPLQATDADQTFTGTWDLGFSVAGAGDLDDDGRDDIIVGDPELSNLAAPVGRAFVWYGPGSSPIPDAELVGNPDSELGTSVAGVGDVNGDGFDDVVVGAPNFDSNGDRSGVALLYLGPVAGTLNPNDAVAILRGMAVGDRAGHSVSAAGDVNGDGFADLLVGAPGNDTGAPDGGMAYLYYGPVFGDLDFGQADAGWWAPRPAGSQEAR